MTDTPEPVLIVDDVGPVRRLTMNRPAALNALNGGLVDAISDAVAAGAADPDVRVMILRGAGRAFCAGYDLNEDAAGGVLDAARWHEDLQRSTARMLEIHDCPKPVIASVRSYCLAGGTDLMLACDLTVASDDAFFGYVDVRFGSGVVSMFLPWVIGVRRAKELLFTGEDRIPADEALRIGLVNRVVPVAELAPTTRALAARIAAGPPGAIGLAKALLNRSATVDLSTSLGFEAYAQAQAITSEDHAEGVRAFLEKRAPRFTGA